MRYTMGGRMGWGKLGRDIIMAENIRYSMLFRAEEQAP